MLKESYKNEQKNYSCSVCGSDVSEFAPLPIYYFKLLDQHQYIHSIFAAETANLFQYSCPNCNASDRDRLYALYINIAFKSIDKGKKYNFVDFAPAPSLSKYIKGFAFLNYRTADLYMENVDDRVDIMHMPAYESDSIDFFLCSHVLEHVASDRSALAELYRIMSPTGWGIIMVPIVLTLNTVYEDSSIQSEEERWKHFGQNDHVRLYSKQGFVERLEEIGFRVKQLGVDFFGKETFQKYGIHLRSVLYIVEKYD